MKDRSLYLILALIVLLISIVTGASYGYWSVTDKFPGVWNFLYGWQELLGAFIGAATPITIFIVQQRIEEKKRIQKEQAHEAKRKSDFFLLLEKNLASAINNLSSIDQMLHRVQDVTLKKLRMRIAEDDAENNYSVGRAFIPMSAVFSLDKEILKESTGSSYIENAIMDCISTSHEMPHLLADISRQFDSTIAMNTQLGLMRVNDPHTHNAKFLDNLNEFEHELLFQAFGHNIPIYLRKLISALIALRSMNTWGLQKWQETFGPNSPDGPDRVKKYFKSEVDEMIRQQQKYFGSKLILVDEKSDYELLMQQNIEATA